MARASPKTAIVGIGQLGAAVATNFLRNNVPLVLYDLQGSNNIPEPLRHLLLRPRAVCTL
jgi:3-hydroxyisobutyrate dehydrogenase-like beta-hydroxyacid dehydrogenase